MRLPSWWHHYIMVQQRLDHRSNLDMARLYYTRRVRIFGNSAKRNLIALLSRRGNRALHAISISRAYNDRVLFFANHAWKSMSQSCKKYFSLNKRHVHRCVIYVIPGGRDRDEKPARRKPGIKREGGRERVKESKKKNRWKFHSDCAGCNSVITFKVHFLKNRELHSLSSLFCSSAFLMRRPKFA